MQVERFSIEGPVQISPRVYGDDRGYFLETWNRKQFAEAIQLPQEASPTFAQDNQSRSSKSVLRGLHYQLPPHAQGKLVRCVRGEIFDVAVDIRRSSPTYGQWVGAHLSEENHSQLWVPAGFAHGFLVLSDSAEVLYKATDFWDKGSERSIRWDDPALAIAWPFPPGEEGEPSVSDKDREAPTLAEAAARGEVFP
ncbi:MAG: dTDP-4-dehydrorhamnose 3,5-epimerase [Cyanobacteriota bacterium]|nr:dTDP-4-dehydrorhamnose 3,5-epimerase [Cyanobacteriota bacterium]